MLSIFPEFKKLELSDKNDIEKITAQYPPYSDFNFTSMWSWDIKEEVQIALLNENLVFRFNDYLTGEPFYSFLGTNDVNDTAEKLLELSKKEGLKLQLKLVSKDSTLGLDKKKFNIIEDTDNFDYIYETEDLKNYPDHKFQIKRRSARLFWRAYPHASVKILDISDMKIQEKVLDLYERWVSLKLEKKKDVDARHETAALKKFFSLFNRNNFLAVGIFVDEILISCSLMEFLESNYILSHFFKADNNYTGVYPSMLQEGLKTACGIQNKVFFNFEQDLGIPGLRNSKTLFRPKYFLEKFTVTEKLY